MHKCLVYLITLYCNSFCFTEAECRDLQVTFFDSLDWRWAVHPCSFVVGMCNRTPRHSGTVNYATVPFVQITLKQKLLSASTHALRVCWKNLEKNVPFESLQKMSKRATPEKIMKYELAVCLHKLHNISFNSREFVHLNSNQIFTSRLKFFITSKSNRIQIGLNCLANRLHIINGLISLDLLNLTMGWFKVHCKMILQVWIE